VNTAVRMLDNVIDINFYAVPQARKSNLKHRPVGLGLMGFQDALYALRLPYTSPQAVEFADLAMEQLSYFAIRASAQLAAERGAYESYEGSLWSQGLRDGKRPEILRWQRAANRARTHRTEIPLRHRV
jgi:ribonucleoside-diphosphate reductase alpha chain